MNKQRGFILLTSLLLGVLLAIVAASVFLQARLGLAMASASQLTLQHQFHKQQWLQEQQAAALLLELSEQTSTPCSAEYAAWSQSVFECESGVLEKRSAHFTQKSLMLIQRLQFNEVF